MTSILGLPTRGSDVTILITKVHLHPLCVLVEFWGNFCQERAAEYECLAKEIQSPENTLLESEGNSGEQCLVQIDGTWYRSRIVSRNGSNYSVFLIDKGVTLNTSSNKLAWGNKKHFHLPPEVEFCVLANVLPLSSENRWSPVALEFLKSLSGKSVKAHVQDVLLPHRTFLLHIPCISKQMYEMGIAKKLSPDVFQEYVLMSLQSQSGTRGPPGNGRTSMLEVERLHKQEQFMFPELQGGTVETVIVTDVTNPLRIFCQLKVFSQELRKLSEQITQCCEGRKTNCVINPEMIGFPCAARGSDGRWYRSVLQQVFPTNQVVEVLNVDYGTKQLVQVENVRSLATEFFRMPVVTYICSLHGLIDKGVGWTTSQIDYLRTLLLSKTVIAKFEYQSISEGVYYVTLYGDENTNINKLFGSNLSCPLESEKTLEDYAICNTPYRRQHPPSLEGCQKTMLEKEERKGVVEKFPAEDLSLNSSHAAVVQHVSDPSEFWIQTTNYANELDTQRPLKAKMPVQTAILPTVQLPDARLSGVHINNGSSFQTLNAVGLASNLRRTPTFKENMFPTGSVLDVCVSYIESPNDFWCQLVQNAGFLKLLMHDIQAYYDGSEFQPPVEIACVARHPDNRMWYRALVIHKHETPHVDVLFVDYGQRETVSLYDLRGICPQFLTLQGQAFRCSLLNPVDPTSATNEWNEEAITKFNSFVQTAASNFVILKCTIYAVMYSEQKIVFNIVDLETPFESVSTSMVNLLKSAPPKKPTGSSFRLDTYYFSTHNVKTGTEEQVTVTSVNNVSQFYCQLEKNADVIKDLNIKVSNLCHQLENVKLPKVFGTLCFAKYTDGQWYRGQIKATRPAILVHFVDYGDTIEVEKSDLLPVPREANDIMSVPVQALVCSLSDVPADVPSQMNSWFETSVTECKFRALVVAREPDGKLQVELYHGNTQINSKIKKMFQIEMEHSEKTVVHQGWRAHDTTRNPTPKRKPEQLKDTPAQNSDIRQVPEVLQKSLKSCSLSYSKQELSEGQKLEVYISTTNEDQTFWCQYADSEELDKITFNVAEVGDSANHKVLDPGSLSPGSPCIALFSDDNLWYRAEVINKEGDELFVFFVDYGNKSKVSVLDVREIPHDLTESPPQAFLCELVGLDASSGSWDSGAVDELLALTVDKALQLTVTRVSKEEGKVKYVVQIECEEEERNQISKEGNETSEPLVLKTTENLTSTVSKEAVCMVPTMVVSLTYPKDIVTCDGGINEAMFIPETEKDTEEEVSTMMDTFEPDDLHSQLDENPTEAIDESGIETTDLESLLGEVDSYNIESSLDETMLSTETNSGMEKGNVSMMDTIGQDDLYCPLDKNPTKVGDESGITTPVLESPPGNVHIDNMESNLDTIFAGKQ
ncbi:tudor domain-containing 6 [Tautogolabrus adspersus]